MHPGTRIDLHSGLAGVLQDSNKHLLSNRRIERLMSALIFTSLVSSSSSRNRAVIKCEIIGSSNAVNPMATDTRMTEWSDRTNLASQTTNPKKGVAPHLVTRMALAAEDRSKAAIITRGTITTSGSKGKTTLTSAITTADSMMNRALVPPCPIKTTSNKSNPSLLMIIIKDVVATIVINAVITIITRSSSPSNNLDTISKITSTTMSRGITRRKLVSKIVKEMTNVMISVKATRDNNIISSSNSRSTVASRSAIRASL
jgi:hypothetical protein